MRVLIVLALLAGWLVTELKDFIIEGGISNILAFGLLKMCFILCLMVLLIIIVAFYEVVLDFLERNARRDLLKAEDSDISVRKKDYFTHRRTNSH